jgi:hypothetical protein
MHSVSLVVKAWKIPKTNATAGFKQAPDIFEQSLQI